MTDIIYITGDKSLEIRLHFIMKHSLKYTHLGKSYPKHTQCLLFTNGLLSSFETVVKHEMDKDNTPLALKIVAEKCLKSIKNKWLRGVVRELLDEELSKL